MKPMPVRQTLLPVIATLLMTLLPAPVLAQFAPASSVDQSEAAELDFRLGGLWPEGAYQTRPSLGGRIGLYLWSGERASRLSLQITGDHRSLGYERVRFEDTTDRFRAGGRIFMLGSALGFDVVRTPTMTVDLRGGVMVRRAAIGLDVLVREGGNLAGDVWQTVCHFEGFRNECGADWGAAGTLAVGLRRHFGAGADYYAGIDYTRVFNTHNILVGSFGVRLR